MTFGGPWNLRGLRPESVDAARVAARRSGMSVGEWLNAIIRERDDDRRAAMQPAGYAEDEDYAWPDESLVGDRGGRRGGSRRDSACTRETALAREELDEIYGRLDTLTRQLERLAQTNGPLRGAPMQPARSLWRANRYAAADGGSAARDADGGEPSAKPDLRSPTTAPTAAPDAAGEPVFAEQRCELPRLEEHLRRITAQIESLRPSTELDKVIAGFRNDLAEIRHQLTAALPRKAVESLCAEVEALAGRIDRSRQWTADPDTIAGIERGLAEIRDALRGMTPAENLVGFDEALKALTQKLDLIIAREDPVAIEQLETAIGALRGVVSHVASNDALNKVAEDVRGLAAKIDALAKGAATGQAVSALGNRIDTLTDAFNASTDAGHAVPRELEKLLAAVLEKLETARLTADPSAFKRVEERIAQLIVRLDASDARLGNLAAIERGLADLLAHIEQLHGGDALAIAGAASQPSTVAAIARDVAEIKHSEQRTQDSLEAVHGTVEQVVGRLAMIENDIHDVAMRAPRRQASAQAVQEKPSSSGPAFAEPTGASSEPLDRQDFIAAARRAIQAAPAASPASEINALSRRRNRSRRGPDERQERKPSRLRKVLVAGGIVLVTAGCLQIALHVLQEWRPTMGAPAPWQRPLPPTADPRANSGAAQPEDAPPSSKAAPTPMLLGPSESAPPRLPAPDAAATANPGPTQNSTSTAPAAPNRDPGETLSPPSISAPPLAPVAPFGQQSALPGPFDATGTLPRPPAIAIAPLPPPSTTNAATPNVATLESAPESLPAMIGGPALRAAAMAGDTAAEFEIAVRFAEGHRVPANDRQAAHWLELAAKQGFAPAQFRLGGYYEKGVGVKKDLAAARDLYLAAATKGNGKAMHNLAVLYADGVTGRSDYRVAALWFRRAADRGVTDSQYNLAILYARGAGAPQDYAEAYKWFALAANQGDVEAARKRDEIASQLDEATLAAADFAVKAWKAEPQPDDAIRVKAPPGGWDGSAQPAKKGRATSARLSALD
jgi:localization factor PodJL